MKRSHKGTRPPQKFVPCMPLLLEEETKPLSNELKGFGGTACEVVVKNYFLSKAMNIAEPHVDVGVDLLIEKPEGWVRGQVKKVVYSLDIDYGILRRSGKKVYRNNFKFNYQGGGRGSVFNKGRNQKSPKDFDYFYHVLLTPYRQLIWETPVNMIPIRPEDGSFIFGKDINLTSENWIRKRAEIDYRKLLIYQHYDPIVFKTYPDFFLQPTLEPFFD